MTDRARRLAKLSPAKRALLERQLAARRRERGGAARGAIPARGAPEGDQPLSFSQERFWFLQQLEPSSAEYNVVAAGRFRGPLNREAMRRALADVVQRHAILRASFPAVDGVPTQRIARELHVALPCVDLSRKGERREALAREEAQRFGAQPFDLAEGPLIRAQLVQLGADDHVLLILQHHIVTDGWSLAVLTRELSAGYSAHVQREAPSLPAPALQFPDFAVWQRETLTGERLERELAFWRDTLTGAPAALELPFDRPRPALQTHAGRTVSYGLGPALSERVRKLAAARGATLFVTLLAAFDALLARLTGQHDVVVGTSIANRDRPEVAGLLGPLMNTLALRVDCGGAPSFVELLARVKACSAAAFAHPEVPFERVVAELVVERDPSHAPVFNVFFDMAVPIPPPDYAGLEVAAFPVDHERAMFDLALSVADGEREVSAEVEFNTDLFDRATVDRIWRAFEVLLAGIVDAPERPLPELPLLDDAERQRVLHDFNATALPLDEGAFLHRCFEQRAQQTPDAPALEHDGAVVSYAELERRANQLARHLRARGVGAETRVAVRLPRSADVLVALLGIWKAGGAYVPVDPGDPPERQRLLLEASRAALLVTRSDLGAAGANDVPVLELDSARDALAAESPAPLEHDTSPDDLAYVIFTSGSTGVPKGVAVTQGALLNHVAWVRDAFDITPADRFLLRTPLTFDASLWELVHPLASGACLVVAPSGVQRDPAALLALTASARITVLQTVPSMLVTWLDEPRFADCTALRHLICAGETLRLDLVHAFDRRCRDAGMTTTLHNLYGPSEACIDASAHVCERGPDGLTRNAGRDTLPIGRPISNAVIHVLDAARQPVPVGVPGELYVGGAGLARGYLDQPELTAERFVPNPFGDGRLYRTGDLGRFLPSGELEYLGRTDHQVKVRGHRIELGEVEVALAAHPRVKEAVVITDGPHGNARLLAYVTRADGGALEPDELRAFLAERLPAHMLPSVFMTLDALPLTASEKIDRAALPAPPSRREAAGGEHVAPRTATEERLAALLAELLELDAVGVHDDFFALGGHSLMATRLASRVRAAWDVEVPLLRYFETPTVAALARAVETALAERDAADGADRDAGDEPSANGALAAQATPTDSLAPDEVPLSFAQQRLWFLARLEPEATHFNMVGVMLLRGDVDVGALDAAFVELLRRHEVLRTVFRERDGAPRGVLLPAPSTLLEVSERRTNLPFAEEGVFEQLVREESWHVFDLARGPLLRARLVRLDDAQQLLVLNQHHVVSDAWSLDVMARELTALYAAHVNGTPAALPALTWQYADFARWQRERLRSAWLDELLTFWRGTLDGAPSGVELPTDRARRATPRHRGRTLRLELPAPLAARARAFARAHDTTPFVVLLTAFQALLHRVTLAEDLVLATAVANRTRLETEALLGFFINTLVLRVDAGGTPHFRELLARSSRAAHAAFAHQDLPFERLVDELGGRRDPSRPPLANVSFNLFHAGDTRWALGDVEARPVDVEPGTSKLDLGVTLIERGDGEALRAELEYDTDLFDGRTVQRLWSLYELLLERCLDAPDTPLVEHALVREADRARLLEYAEGQPMHDAPLPCVERLVARHARATPHAEALVCGDTRVDYAALDARIDALAARLRALELPRDALVGLCLPRGVDAVAAPLACWRAGAAWVPVMPSDPPARRRSRLADVGVAALVTRREFTAELDGVAPHTLCIEEVDDTRGTTQDALPTPRGDAEHGADVTRTASAPAPDALAYVLFTSGSTGHPKAVEMTHAALDHHTSWFVRRFGFDASDRVLHKIPLSFDAALLELLPALAAGGTLVLASDDAAMDPAALVDLGAREGCTVLIGVPSLLGPMAEHPRFGAWRTLRRAFSGGERLPASLARRLTALVPPRVAEEGVSVDARGVITAEEPATLQNLYGPTEACVNTTSFACRADADEPVPIGRPLAGVRAYVVDARGDLLPELVPGELLIGGAGLARGYRGDREATRRAFVSDPFVDGTRAYRSGDLVRRRVGGELVHLGRLDAQLKVRGHRVEPGELEAVLGGCAGVRELAVSCGDGVTLTAHVVGTELTRAGLTRFAAAQLPPALRPSRWLLVDALPRTASGKLDRAALDDAARAAPLEVDADTTSRPAPDASRRPLDAQLAALMGETLGRAPLAAGDDFFEHGGHSLLAIRFVARVSETLDVELPLRAVFLEPTPAGLARVVARLRRGESLDAAGDGARVDLFAEARLDDDIRPPTAAPRADTPPATAPRPDAAPHAAPYTAPLATAPTPATTHTASPREILLTGATGFLGAFLLRELLDRADDPRTRVHALVRARDDHVAHERLVANLERYELWEPALAERVVAHAGDLGSPRLGLSAERFAELAEQVDLIVHSGAAVNFFHDYARLKAPNVDGTRELLRLACTARATPFHFVSTIGVLAAPHASELTELAEDVPLDKFADLEGGYEQSKWVAEQLVHAAGRRGLPVSVYRPGRIVGHARSGVGNLDDVGSRVLRGCLELGVAPAVDTPVDMTPVDYVAAAIARLALRGTAAGRAYHLVNPERVPLSQVFEWARDEGHPLRLLPWADWLAELDRTVAQDPSSTLYPLLPLFAAEGADESDFAPDVRLPPLASRHVREDLAGSAITCPRVDRAMLARWLADFARRGQPVAATDHEAPGDHR